jgi:hypothetical protein
MAIVVSNAHLGRDENLFDSEIVGFLVWSLLDKERGADSSSFKSFFF